MTTLFKPDLGVEVTFQDPQCGLFFDHGREDDEALEGGWWWALRENKLRMGHRNTAKVLLDLRDGSEAQREALMEALRSRGSTFQGVRDLLRRMRTPHVEEDFRLQHRTSLEVAWSSWTEAERLGARVRLAGFFGRWWSEGRVIHSPAHLLPVIRLAEAGYGSTFGAPASHKGVVVLSVEETVLKVSFPRDWPSLFTGGVDMEWQPRPVLGSSRHPRHGEEPLPLPQEGWLFDTLDGVAYRVPEIRNGILPLPTDPHLEGWEVRL